VGVDIFFREAQVAWAELFPFVDRRVGQAARRLGLGPDPRALAGDRNPEAFARLVAALIRTGLAGDHDAVLEAARARSPTDYLLAGRRGRARGADIVPEHGPKVLDVPERAPYPRARPVCRPW
jgi:hypothetical protein